MTKTPNVICGYCKVGFYRLPSKMKSKSGIYFCSREHQGKASRNEVGIIKCGPPKSDFTPRSSFSCRFCGKHQNTTITNKTFCDEVCKSKHLETLTHKTCSTCHNEVPISDFPIAKDAADGFSSKCKECVADVWSIWYLKDSEEKKAKNRSRNLDWYQTEKGQKSVLMKRLRRYGITFAEFAVMIDRCGGKCEICKKNDFQAIDHCHETGKVRGLLCHKCNLSLGGFNDNIDSLRNAIKYLEGN